MSEILTESFCERCGTRYTFESARPKIRLKGVKVLSRGLKNFVLSDDTTLDEAMAAARSETDREVTGHQLDAFHKTFNFCMSCRQYTCPNCWNEVEARCLSCAPLLAQEIVPAVFPGLASLGGTTNVAEPTTNGANGQLHDGGETELVLATEPEVAVKEPIDEVAAAHVEAAAELATMEPADKASSQTAGLLRRFRPGQSIDDELAAYERERTDAKTQDGVPEFIADPAGLVVEAVEPVAEAMLSEPEPERVEAAATVAEPVADADAEAAPVPAEAKAEAAPVLPAQPELEPADAAAADLVEQPTWQITAPDAERSTGSPATPSATPISAPSNGSPLPTVQPQWPTKPEWPAAQAPVGLPFLGRPAQPQGGVEALWAASNQELVATPPAPGRSTSGIQPCISCGLSLSATARFCRRCGTLQGS